MSAALEWARVRISLVREPVPEPQGLRDASDVAGLFARLVGDDPREHFVAAYLDAQNRPLAVHVVAVGASESCPVDCREVYRPAVALGASAVIVGHNHPSGILTPSPHDHAVTVRLEKAAILLGIRFLDHIVFCGPAWRSIVAPSGGEP